MKKIKAVLFDHDDTLVKTSTVRYPAFKEIAASYGQTLRDDTIRAAWGLPMHDFIIALYQHVDSNENIIAKYNQVKMKYPTIAEDQALETITTLLKTVQIGVVSAASKDMVTFDLASLHFPIDQFTKIQGAEETPKHKPDPEVFIPMFAHLANQGITKQEIIYVGDAISDFQAANQADIRFYGLADRTTSKDTFIQQGSQTISNLAELLNIV